MKSLKMRISVERTFASGSQPLKGKSPCEFVSWGSRGIEQGGVIDDMGTLVDMKSFLQRQTVYEHLFHKTRIHLLDQRLSAAEMCSFNVTAFRF